MYSEAVLVMGYKAQERTRSQRRSAGARTQVSAGSIQLEAGILKYGWEIH